jgi:hypothetical protein
MATSFFRRRYASYLNACRHLGSHHGWWAVVLKPQQGPVFTFYQDSIAPGRVAALGLNSHPSTQLSRFSPHVMTHNVISIIHELA